MDKNINIKTVFKKVNNRMLSYLKRTDSKQAVTFEKPVVKETPMVIEYKPSEKKVSTVRTTEQILAGMEAIEYANTEIQRHSLVKPSPEQVMENLKRKTENMIQNNKAESHINNRTVEVNQKYALTDNNLSVSTDVWYKIIHKTPEQQYHLSYQNGIAYIVSHLSSIHMLVLEQTSPMGLRGTEQTTHLPFSRFTSLIQNGPSIKNISTIYKIVPVVKSKEAPRNEDFWKNPIPVFNVTD